MKKKILARVAAFAVAAMASVTAFAASLYSIPSDKVLSGNVALVGKDGIYSSASELSDLTYIKLTATTNYDKPSELSGSFKIICDEVTQTFKWTVETGDNVIFKFNGDDNVYEAIIESVIIPSNSSKVELAFENENEINTLNITGIELGGISEPKKSETEDPPKGSSDIVSEEPSSNVSSEITSSSKITESSSKTNTSIGSVSDENDNSNKPTGVGTGLAFAGIAIAAAAAVSLKKSK